MSGERKDVLNQPNASRADDEEPPVADGESSSYYYDDATGYQIYQDEPEDNDEEADKETDSTVC